LCVPGHLAFQLSGAGRPRGWFVRWHPRRFWTSGNRTRSRHESREIDD
jgi:hypothetical protein